MIAATFPQNSTQPARLLAVLLEGRKVDPLYAWKSLGIYRLSDTVFRLRADGWPVITGRLDVDNHFGEQCHVASYFLDEEKILAAGEDGQTFARREIAAMAELRRAA